MNNKGVWTAKHKAYAIERRGQMASYQKVLDELKDVAIGQLFNFTPLPKDVRYMLMWEKLQNPKVKKKIQEARDEYKEMLRKTLSITDDEKLFELLQKIVDDPTSINKDVMRAIELSHKIRETKRWQDAHRESGGEITKQMIKNLMVEIENSDDEE